MIDWFSFTPQDTLYFRGAEPANMGESHAASMIFPPPGHTIAGALRTAVLVQNDIAFTDYNEGVLPPDKKSITEMIGDSGADCPFQVIGPLFSLEERVWVPCPFIWFSEKKDGGNMESEVRTIAVSTPVAKNSLLKTATEGKLFWAVGKNLETLGGFWVPLDELCSSKEGKAIRETGDFFASEIHTGIALDVKNTRRMARKHHLYSFVHARLRQGVELVFGVTRKLPLAGSGVFKLGAEQRFGEYRKMDNVEFPHGKSGLFMALSNLPGDEETNRCCIATGKIRYFGGWDLHRGFHKPMRGFFPAGSVFDQKINENCIAL